MANPFNEIQGAHGLGCALLVASLVAVSGASVDQAGEGRLPAALEDYFTNVVRLSPSERTSLLAGSPVTKLLNTESADEVAVFGAVWIQATAVQDVEQLKDIENFERGGAFRVTKRISDPPRLADFALLSLPDGDLADLRTCRVGSCEVKLEEPALLSFQTKVDWSKPTAESDAQALFRRIVFEYVARYRLGGNARLAVFRDADKPTFVADELRSMIERLPLLTSRPDLRRYLLEYPAVSLRGSTAFLYWQETTFGLKPTIRVNHLVIQQQPEATVVASKLIYATHYFWTALELRVLTPDPARGRGFWFVMVNRSRSDGLSGLIGRMIRGTVSNEAIKGTLAALATTKTRLETHAR